MSPYIQDKINKIVKDLTDVYIKKEIGEILKLQLQILVIEAQREQLIHDCKNLVKSK